MYFFLFINKFYRNVILKKTYSSRQQSQHADYISSTAFDENTPAKVVISNRVYKNRALSSLFTFFINFSIPIIFSAKMLNLSRMKSSFNRNCSSICRMNVNSNQISPQARIMLSTKV